MFPNKELPNDISLIGRPYTQSLLHAMKIGTVDLSSKSKIAIVVSLQWFWGNEIDQAGFAANFSKLQFYDAIKDSSMTKDTKDYICNRIYSVLSNTDGFEDIKLFAYMNSHDGILSKAGKLILAPYYSIDQKLLNLKDKWETYQALKATEVSKAAIRDINWKEQTQIATAQGKKNCTNNPFYVDDNYYNEYLKSQIETLRSSSQTEKLISSELTDYEFFLKICKQKGIKPYIILMCTNGRYYDYIGIDKETRGNLYNRLEKVAESYGMEVLNLSDKEYEPYFMKDGMHLGWKGWLYVNRKICEHFAKTEK